MRIQHNIAALNSHRQLTANNSAVSKNLEKLSSGYRINRAGDDAAGLAISEKMRAQITGLDTAQKNAQDGISLVQTAEGALTEVHSMLNRMVELATQSANGTYQDDVDRENIQKEVDSLRSEIDRIAESSNYNGIKLLDGSLGSGGSAGSAGKAAGKLDMTDFAKSIGSYKFTDATAGVYEAGGAAATLNADGDKSTHTITYTDESGKEQTVKVGLKFDDSTDKIIGDNGTSTTATDGGATAVEVGNALKAELEKTDFGKQFDVSVDGADGHLTFTAKNKGTAGGKVLSISEEATVTTTNPGAPEAVGVTAGITGASGTGTQVTGDASKKAEYVYTFGTPTGNFKAGEKITINGKELTFGDGTGGTIAIGASFDKTMTNVATALTGEAAKMTVTKTGTNAGIAAEAGAWSYGESTHKLTWTSTAAVATGDSVAATGYAPTTGVTNLVADYTGAPGPSVTARDTTTNVIDMTGGGTSEATDKYESMVFGNGSTTGLNAWDGTSTSDVNSHIFEVDGQKFAFANSSATALKFDKDVNVITISDGTTTAAAADVAKMADLIKQKTGTNAVATGTQIDFKATEGTSGTAGKGGLSLQVGDTSDSYQKVTVKVESMSTSSLGIDKLSVATQASSNSAIDMIKKAINTVSSTRGDLGAIQNRLEHTISNLGVTSENMSAAESRIRDVDMAQEMMAFTKNNILTQASQAMLAQANQLPQGVLQLLQ